MGNLVDLSGQRFGQLVVIGRVAGSKSSRWLCACDCGRESTVRTSNLTSGNSKSCGCLHRPHGHTWEGGSTSEYRSWLAMRQRCSNPKHDSYPDYGGRGVRVCDRWQESFVAFLADMGPKPSPNYQIDRIDVNGHYEPGNCRWATRSEQRRNTRRTRPGHSDAARMCIRVLHARGAQGKVLARAFGVSEAFVSEVVNHGA